MSNSYYVYALKDPRSNPAKIFYIGKGTGSRDEVDKTFNFKAVIDKFKHVKNRIKARIFWNAYNTIILILLVYSDLCPGIPKLMYVSNK